MTTGTPPDPSSPRLTRRSLLDEGWASRGDEWCPPGWNFGVAISEVRTLRALLLSPPAPLDPGTVELLYAADFYCDGDRWFQRCRDRNDTAEHTMRYYTDHERTPGLSHRTAAEFLRQQGGVFGVFFGPNASECMARD